MNTELSLILIQKNTIADSQDQSHMWNFLFLFVVKNKILDVTHNNNFYSSVWDMEKYDKKSILTYLLCQGS